jgi:hypothetical protein
MGTNGLARVLPFTAAAVFFAMAATRPAQRGLWIAAGVIFLVLGVRRTRRGGGGDRT